MMGKNKSQLKITWILLFIVQNSFAQNIVLRPGIGIRYFSTKPNSEPSYFDPSFNATFKFSEPAVNIGVELMYPKYSYEIIFNSHHVADGMATKFDKVGAMAFKLNGGLRQFQFLYNRFISVKKQSNFMAIAGIGGGVGINRPQSVYDADTFYTVGRIYSINYPNEYIDFNCRTKSLSKMTYSVILKAGFLLKKKNVERARITAVYNLGLKRIVRSSINYSHTNINYFGASSSKGNQFFLIYSMPIYLKRKK